MDLGVAGDPSLEGVLEVDFLLRWCGAPLIIVLRINLNVIEWSKIFCFGRVPEVFDVGDQSRTRRSSHWTECSMVYLL